MKILSLLLPLFLLAAFPSFAASVRTSSCTTMIVTRGASADGSVMVAHSDDNHLMDNSIVHVPAKDWPKGAMRPVFPSGSALDALPEFNAMLVPRLVNAERAPAYARFKGAPTLPLGEIPQVPHTYAYLDGNYGIANEHGLMFGECTDGTLFTIYPEKGKRLFYSAELSRVALERCKTAREAIALIGSLIETYGYYGTGETLPVADANEAWVIEMAPSPEGVGGLWVAQIVPDGEFFVAANEFRIREIIPGRPDYQMYGNTLNTIERLGIRHPKDTNEPVDWLLSVSKGEYSHPYYSLRRVWRAFDLAAPSLKLSPWVENGATRAYPFSVKPDKKLDLNDIRHMYSDHYEGTEFDLTKGVAAGPFGNPNRYLGPDDPSGDVGEHKNLKGAWERPICAYYTGYSYISQLRPDLPHPINLTSWVALNTPGESVFVPLAVAPLPEGYERADARAYDPDSYWWTYNLVGEWANLKYSYIIKDIRARAAAHESSSRKLLDDVRLRLAPLAKSNPEQALAEYGKELGDNATRIRTDWQRFFHELAAKYAQGCVNAPEKMAVSVGYPRDWLDATDYSRGPTQYEKYGPEVHRD